MFQKDTHQYGHFKVVKERVQFSICVLVHVYLRSYSHNIALLEFIKILPANCDWHHFIYSPTPFAFGAWQVFILGPAFNSLYEITQTDMNQLNRIGLLSFKHEQNLLFHFISIVHFRHLTLQLCQVTLVRELVDC